MEETTKISVGNDSRWATVPWSRADLAGNFARCSRCLECGRRIYLDIGDKDGCNCESPKMRNWGEYATVCPDGCVMVGVEEACGSEESGRLR